MKTEIEIQKEKTNKNSAVKECERTHTTRDTAAQLKFHVWNANAIYFSFFEISDFVTPVIMLFGYYTHYHHECAGREPTECPDRKSVF